MSPPHSVSFFSSSLNDTSDKIVSDIKVGLCRVLEGHNFLKNLLVKSLICNANAYSKIICFPTGNIRHSLTEALALMSLVIYKIFFL